LGKAVKKLIEKWFIFLFESWEFEGLMHMLNIPKTPPDNGVSHDDADVVLLD